LGRRRYLTVIMGKHPRDGDYDAFVARCRSLAAKGVKLVDAAGQLGVGVGTLTGRLRHGLHCGWTDLRVEAGLAARRSTPSKHKGTKRKNRHVSPGDKWREVDEDAAKCAKAQAKPANPVTVMTSEELKAMDLRKGYVGNRTSANRVAKRWMLRDYGDQIHNREWYGEQANEQEDEDLGD
jgi:hypothetical protein